MSDKLKHGLAAAGLRLLAVIVVVAIVLVTI